MKRLNQLILTLLALAMALALCACGGEGGSKTPAGDPTYKVSVVDGSGNPYTSGIIVRILKGEEQAAMEVIGEDGTVSKQLPAGDYTVELKFTDSKAVYHYDAESAVLSAAAPELQIVLAKSLDSAPQPIHAYSLKSGETTQRDAYAVTAGSTFVALEQNERNYFLFAPTEAGTYRVSVRDAEVALGYYGAPHFVQQVSAAELEEDGSFTLSIKASMIGSGESGTTVLVIGVDAGEVGECTLNVERIGEPEWTVEDEPWSTYMTTAELAPYTLPAGATLKKFDLTAAGYELVLNETDGFYHLNSADGPLVLVYLGADVEYLDCFQTILEHSGVTKYFYDDQGEFVKKEDYSQCLLEYFGYMDEENGVYPLTEDLKYIIQQRGDYAGWWNTEGNNYIFKDVNGERVPGINSEIAWLFMCCYIG